MLFAKIESFLAAVPLSVVVVCSVVLFIVGLLGGFAGGTLLGYCWWGRAHQRKPHPPPAPLYEDVDLPAGQDKRQELKLEENIAYGHITG